MAKSTELSEESKRRVAAAVAKVLRDPKLSKSAMTAAGLDLGQRPPRPEDQKK